MNVVCCLFRGLCWLVGNVFVKMVEGVSNQIPIPPPLPALPAGIRLNPKVFQDLLHTCERGDVDKLRKILPEYKEYINVTNGILGETLLHIATRKGHTSCTRLLLENNADVNCVDKKGKTPVHIASAAGNLESLRVLIEHGAALNKRDKFGRACLHWATMLNKIECVKELLKAGAELVVEGNWQPLHEAAKAGNNDIIKLLLDSGCDVKNPSKYPSPGRPWSPLHVACRQGKLETVKLLITSGANVTTFNGGGHTPLHEAAYRGFEQILIELLKNGAKPNAKSNQLRTPLHEACIQGRPACVVLLLDAGSDVNAQDLIMETPLHYVVKSSNSRETKLQLVDVLLRYGANCAILGKDDDTCVDAAYSNYFPEAVELMKESFEIPRALVLLCKIQIRKLVFACKRMNEFSKLLLPLPLINYVAGLEVVETSEVSPFRN